MRELRYDRCIRPSSPSALQRLPATAAGPGGGRGGRGGGAARRRGRPRRDRPRVQRISIQREVDLSGTLLSPDQAKVSSEVAGIVREVPVAARHRGARGRRARPPRAARARSSRSSAPRARCARSKRSSASTGRRTSSRRPTSRSPRCARRPPTATTRAPRSRAPQQLSGRGLLSQVDRDTADTRLKVAEANYQAALDTVRSLKASLQDRRASYELAQKKLADAVDPRAGRRLGVRAAGAAGRVHPREHAGRRRSCR